jgi:acetyl-CoA synthetase
MYWIGLREGDLHWNISSPGWAKHAWSSFFAPWNAGAAIFAFNYERFDAKRVLDALVAHRVTTLCAPPTVWRMLILEDLRAWRTSLREIVGAGEPLNPEVIDRVCAAWGITIRDGYGQTETTAMFGNSPRQEVKPGSMGRPLPGYAVALLDSDGAPSDDGEIAVELAPAPAGLMAGYLDTPMPVLEAGGRRYYRTFDMASRDRDGYYWFIGRVDDVFKSSDYRISPFELESALIEHEAVAEPPWYRAPTRCASPYQKRSSCSRRVIHPPWKRPARSSCSVANAWRRTSGFGVSSSAICRRRSRERSAACNCAPRSIATRG